MQVPPSDVRASDTSDVTAQRWSSPPDGRPCRVSRFELLPVVAARRGTDYTPAAHGRSGTRPLQYTSAPVHGYWYRRSGVETGAAGQLLVYEVEPAIRVHNARGECLQSSVAAYRLDSPLLQHGTRAGTNTANGEQHMKHWQ